jgi:hypothetical protein
MNREWYADKSTYDLFVQSLKKFNQLMWGMSPPLPLPPPEVPGPPGPSGPCPSLRRLGSDPG